jgi:hypothetical protein
MQLHSTSISSYKPQPETLLAEGSYQDIADFINSVRSGWGVGGPLTEADLDENGGSWGSLPDGWTPEKQYYWDSPEARCGGFVSVEDAVLALVGSCEYYLITK